MGRRISTLRCSPSALLKTQSKPGQTPGQTLQSNPAHPPPPVKQVADKVGHIHVHEGEKGVVEAIILLLASIVCVPLVVKLLPGGCRTCLCLIH